MEAQEETPETREEVNAVEELTEVEWEADPTLPGNHYTTTIINPSTDAELSVYLELPSLDGPFPTILLVPGGTGSGIQNFTNSDEVTMFLEAGVAVAFFDPDGRGRSTGEENYNGHDGQDGLYAVSQAVAASEWVDEDEMGIMSFSYGTTLASGMLARYAEDQPFEWYVDWEGPSAREYTTVGCDATAPMSPDDPGLSRDCDDDEYWGERESVTFLTDVLIPYWRIQAEKDHVQPNNQHAIDAINAATEGKCPWTRLNLEKPNQTFSDVNEADYIKGRAGVGIQMAVESALELFESY